MYMLLFNRFTFLCFSCFYCLYMYLFSLWATMFNKAIVFVIYKKAKFASPQNVQRQAVI